MISNSGVAWVNLLLAVYRGRLVLVSTLRPPLTGLARVTRVRSVLRVTWLEHRLLTRDRRHVSASEAHSPHAGPAAEDVSVTLDINIQTSDICTGCGEADLERLLDPGLEPGHDGVHLGDQGLGDGRHKVQQVTGVGHAQGLLLSLDTGHDLV